MNSIHFHTPLKLFLPSHPVAKPQWKAKTSGFNNQPTRLLVKLKRTQKTTTRAISQSLILEVSSRGKPGDVSVLLQTGALLLFVYGIANFVFPAFIFKYYEFDKVNQDPVPDDVTPSPFDEYDDE